MIDEIYIPSTDLSLTLVKPYSGPWSAQLPNCQLGPPLYLSCDLCTNSKLSPGFNEATI